MAVAALAARVRSAFQRGGSGVAVAAMAAASVVVLVLVLALRLGVQQTSRLLAAHDEWAVGIEGATPAQVAWALLGVALCSYHLVRKEPQPPARPADAPQRQSPLSAASTALSDSARAAVDLVAEAWTSLPSLPSLPSMDWALPTLSSISSERSDAEECYSTDEGDDATSAASQSAPQLTLVDELSPPERRAPTAAINSERPIPFENDMFKGSLLFLVNDQTPRWSRLFGDKKRLLCVQLQGQFKRAPPPGAVVYLAWELPVRSVDHYLGFWAHKLIRLLASIVQRFNSDVHISLGGAVDGNKGEQEGMEVPHVAFPLYQRVDELVISRAGVRGELPASRLPVLGQEAFGESETHAKCRAALPVGKEPRELFSSSKVYTFQFHSMLCDLAQWRLVNLPGLPGIPLQRICGVHPIRLSAYALVSDLSRQEQRHVDRAKEYLLCFSVRHPQSPRLEPPRAPRFVPQVTPIAIPTPSLARTDSGSSSGSSDDGSSTTGGVLSPRSSDNSSSGLLSPAFASYARSEPLLRRALLLANETPLSPTIRRFAAASHALSALQFELGMWIERVDPVAGKRSVAYVFTVDESSDASSFSSAHPPRRVRRTVVRSASTIKNVLLALLDRDDDSDSDDEAMATDDGAAPRGSFRGLVTESREFQYERIDDETAHVSTALQEIAAPATASPLSRDRYSLSVMRATLLHCLTSPSPLPPVRSARDIGVQLPSQLSAAQVLCELGGYRALTAQCMRQEWVVLSACHVHFFRSFSVRASKIVPLHQVLAVRAIDGVDVLRDWEERESGADAQSPKPATRPEPTRWFGLEIHLMLEVVTLFVETSGERAAFIRACNQRLDALESDPKRQGMFSSPALPLDNQSLSVCLNQRVVWRRQRTDRRPSRVNDSERAETTAELVKAGLRAAMTLFAVKDRQKWTAAAVLALLDAVEKLNNADLAAGAGHASHSQRLAFALHLYHTLLLHAVLVFGSFPRSHPQWRKMQVVPSYLVGDPKFPERQVRFTLREIERELLRSPMPPASVLLDGASSFMRLRSPFGFRLGTSSPGSSGQAAVRLPVPGVTSPTARRVVMQPLSRIPEHLALDRPDFRSCFLLQINSDPAVTDVIRVYERTESGGQAAVTSPRRRETLDEQFNRTCARFLATELRVDTSSRTIHVPRVCDWYFQMLEEQRLARSTSDPTTGSSSNNNSSSSSSLAVSGSRAFFCLQRLMPFMDDAMLQRVQHLLMGAGDACSIDFGEFWTHQSAAKMLSEALTRSQSSSSLLGLDNDGLGEVGSRAEAISLANSNGLVRFLRSIF